MYLNPVVKTHYKYEKHSDKVKFNSMPILPFKKYHYSVFR